MVIATLVAVPLWKVIAGLALAKNYNRIRKGPVFFFGDGRSELDHVAAREREPDR
jgi:hypothetical protein